MKLGVPTASSTSDPLKQAPPSQQQTPTNPIIANIVLQFVQGLQQFLGRNFALHKMVASLVLTFWKGCGFKDQLVPQLMAALTEEAAYEDLMPFILTMQKDCHVCKKKLLCESMTKERRLRREKLHGQRLLGRRVRGGERRRGV